MTTGKTTNNNKELTPPKFNLKTKLFSIATNSFDNGKILIKFNNGQIENMPIEWVIDRLNQTILDDHQISLIKSVKTISYKKKNYSVWNGKGAEKQLKKFLWGFKTFDFKERSMFHITLKVHNKQKYTPKELDKFASYYFGRLVSELKRKSHNFEINKYQAIKEFDERNDNKDFPAMHFHLFLETKKNPKNSIMKIINNFWNKEWNIGSFDIRLIEDQEYFKNSIKYCTEEKEGKRNQMNLPKEYLDCTGIRRLFPSQGLYTSKDKIKFPFFKVMHKEILASQVKAQIDRDNQFNHKDKNNNGFKASTAHTRKKGKGKNESKRSYKPRGNQLTYDERLKMDKTVMRIQDQKTGSEYCQELNVPMDTIYGLGGEYDDKKGYCVITSSEVIDNLIALGEIKDLIDRTEK